MNRVDPTAFSATPPPSEGSVGETYLRGVQLTDGDGLAEFATIYPGRTTHIHVKVHIGGRKSDGTYLPSHGSAAVSRGWLYGKGDGRRRAQRDRDGHLRWRNQRR